MIPSILEVRGIGPATVKILAEQGIHSVAELAAVHVKQLTTLPGFSDIRAAQVIDDATQLLVDTDEPPEQPINKDITKQKTVLKNKKNKKKKDAGKKKKANKATKSDKKVKNKKTKKTKKQSNKKQSGKGKKRKKA